MTKVVDDSVMDAALAKTATCVMLRVCSGDPANRAAAITNTLASVVLTAGDGNGDFTIANGDTNGRKVTMAQQADISVSASGTAAVVTLDDGTTMLLKTDLSSTLGLTSGGTVTVNAFDQEIADAA